MDIFSSYCGKAIEETHSWKHKNVPKSSYNCKIGEHDWIEGRCRKCGVFAIDWAEIPTGTFAMGSPKSEVGRDCESQHKRKLCAFRMSKYAITFEQYDAFCEASASAQANFGNTSSYSLLVDEITDDLTKSSGSNNNNPKSEFCGKTTPVGSFAPNNWDLYDMHGNVEEWTCTYWSGDYKPTGSKPKFKSNEILMRRGGSWKHNKQCCRSAYREANYTSDYKTNYIGFRVVEGKYNL